MKRAWRELNIHSFDAVSFSVLLEEFRSHYHFIWFHSTHLHPHTRMDHICEISRKTTPRPTTLLFTFWKKGKPSVLATNVQLQSARMHASNFYSVLYQSPTGRPASSTEFSFNLSEIFPWRRNRKYLDATRNYLSSQAEKKHWSFNAGNIYKGGIANLYSLMLDAILDPYKEDLKMWPGCKPSASLPLISQTAIFILPLLPLHTSSCES